MNDEETIRHLYDALREIAESGDPDEVVKRGKKFDLDGHQLIRVAYEAVLRTAREALVDVTPPKRKRSS